MQVGNEPQQYSKYYPGGQQQQQSQNRMQQPYYNPNVQQHTQQYAQHDSLVLALARRIKMEQGGLYAGYFLNAVRPYVAPAEIIMIERTLSIQAETDPRPFAKQENPSQGKGNDMSTMLPLLMSMMNKNSDGGGGGIDPMMLMKMMNKQ